MKISVNFQIEIFTEIFYNKKYDFSNINAVRRQK